MTTKSEKIACQLEVAHFRRVIQGTYLATALLFLAGCAGVGKPIPDHIPKELASEKRDALRKAYEDPVELAYNRINQWSTAVENLQTSNTVASSALLPLAAIIGYRTARGKSSAATAGLATGGIIGLTLSDALIQINRLDVYLKGIKAMECAVNHYSAAHIPPKSMDTFWTQYPELEQNTQAKILLSQLYTSIFSESLPSTTKIRLEMANAVSRITSEVNQALRSSIVSVHDLSRTTLPAGTFRQSLASDRDDDKADPVGIAERFANGATALVQGKNFEQPTSVSEDQLTDALLDLDRMQSIMESLDVNQDEVASSIRSCSVIQGLSPLIPDRIASAPVELGIVSVNESDRVLVGCEGNEKTFPIAGGIPPYTTQLSPESDKISAAVQRNQVQLTVIQNFDEGDESFAVNVWDKDKRHASIAISVSKGDECGEDE